MIIWVLDCWWDNFYILLLILCVTQGCGACMRTNMSSMALFIGWTINWKSDKFIQRVPVETFVQRQFWVNPNGPRHAGPHGGCQLLVALHGPFPWRYVGAYILLPPLLLLRLVIHFLLHHWEAQRDRKEKEGTIREIKCKILTERVLKDGKGTESKAYLLSLASQASVE